MSDLLGDIIKIVIYVIIFSIIYWVIQQIFDYVAPFWPLPIFIFNLIKLLAVLIVLWILYGEYKQ